eukprot:g21488.t1
MPVRRAPVTINDDMFLTVRDAPFFKARQHVAALVASHQCQMKTVMQQTLPFFAAARYGEDEEALELCDTLLRAGVPLNQLDALGLTQGPEKTYWHVHTCNFLVCSRSDINTIDKFGETALFYAVKRSRVAAVEMLLDHGVDFEVVNHKKQSVLTAASASELCTVFQEARKKRRLEVTEGEPGQRSKRPRSALEQLEAWADEWPMRHPKIETADFKQKDGAEWASTGKPTRINRS